MPRLTKNSLQKHLQHLEKEELVEEIVRLFGKFKAVNEHFQMEFGESTKEVVDVYKAQVRKAFFGSRSRRPRPRLSVAKKVIGEFRKVALFEYDVIDLLLYRVEIAIEFINTHEYPFENFYKAIHTTFIEAVNLINQHQLEGQFRERCEKIVWYAGHNRYFGLHRTLWGVFEAAFPAR